MTAETKRKRRSESPLVRAHLQRIAKAGGTAGGAKKRQQAAEQWRAEAGTLPPGQLAAKFYRRGYNNGYTTGRRSGYAAGWDAACQAMGKTPQQFRAMHRNWLGQVRMTP